MALGKKAREDVDSIYKCDERLLIVFICQSCSGAGCQWGMSAQIEADICFDRR